MGSRGLLRLGPTGFLAMCVVLACCCTWAGAANSSVNTAQAGEKHTDVCGWIGVTVSPTTREVAASLRMTEPYGAIFGAPQPRSPAALAQIEQGDVLTLINGAPLIRASDFAEIIARMAPRTTVYLYTWRNGQPRQVQVILGAAPCSSEGRSQSPRASRYSIFDACYPAAVHFPSLFFLIFLASFAENV